jgi:molybdopterin converting factor small subunit
MRKMEVEHVVTVTLAASLASYLPEDEAAPDPAGHRSVTLPAETWTETVREIRARYRRLGEHMFEESGKLRSGLLVAVNDQLDRHQHGLHSIRGGDNIFVFAQIAGG